jgi:hypothetical protein
VLKEVKGRIQGNLGDVATPIKERLNDSNKNLVSITLGHLGMIACAFNWMYLYAIQCMTQFAIQSSWVNAVSQL